MFFGRRDLFFLLSPNFFQASKIKLDAGRHVLADFHVNRLGDSLELRAREKKRKSMEKHNITFASQNGNIIIYCSIL